MNSITTTATLATLISTTFAVKIDAIPDVFGPNGVDYQNESTDDDYSQIGIDIVQKGKEGAEKCRTGAWTKLHWTGKLVDGSTITDSRMEGDGRPKTFNLGQSSVYQCWDLAIQQLTAGSKAKIHCPAYLVYGTSEAKTPLGDSWVPKGSDVNFDVEVVDCNITPEEIDPLKYKQPVTTTMQPDSCMYLHLLESDNTGYDLVLSSQEKDVSEEFPGKWAMLEQKVVDDENQQWFYNAVEGSLTNKANPNYRLDDWDGYLYLANLQCKAGKPKGFPTEARKWYYDKDSAMTSVVDGVKKQMGIWGQPKQWAIAEVGPYELLSGGPSGKWKIEYCYLR